MHDDCYYYSFSGLKQSNNCNYSNNTLCQEEPLLRL